MSAKRGFLAGAFAGLLASASFAQTSTGILSVSITLFNPGFLLFLPDAPGAVPVLGPGACISETLGRQAQALVRVACGSGQFVSITPMPGKPFLGTHGGAFRYHIDVGAASTVLPADADSFYRDMGTVTALRVFNANDPDGFLELLVRF